jgi:putative transposase
MIMWNMKPYSWPAPQNWASYYESPSPLWGEGLWTKKRHTPEQIVRKLREAEAELAAGASVPEVAKRLGISKATFHRWRNQYGGMKTDAMKRLKELESENARLKKIVAEQAVDIDILKEVSRKNFWA